MSTRHAENMWDALAKMPDEEIPLLRTALMVAQDEYPALDIADYESAFDELASGLQQRLAGIGEAQERLGALNSYLFREQGFSGNHNDYYDPRNCYINDVLDRRLGIPITLAVLQIELARRVGVPLSGVSFPGHFLVSMPLADGLIVLDPYLQGRSLGAQELKSRAKPHLGDHDIDDQQLLSILEPASHLTILSRMLRNLKGVYAERGEWDKGLRCADRLVRLQPTEADERRDRGLFYLKIGHLPAASEDLMAYLSLKPDAEDADAVRGALVEASAAPIRFN